MWIPGMEFSRGIFQFWRWKHPGEESRDRSPSPLYAEPFTIEWSISIEIRKLISQLDVWNYLAMYSGIDVICYESSWGWSWRVTWVNKHWNEGAVVFIGSHFSINLCFEWVWQREITCPSSVLFPFNCEFPPCVFLFGMWHSPTFNDFIGVVYLLLTKNLCSLTC
jgi:hypothetical protein